MNLYNQIDSNKRKSIALIAIFVIVVAFLGWLFGQVTDFGNAGLVIAVIISVSMALFSYYKGDKVALKTSGAIEIEKQESPYLYNMVENLCITAGLPKPKVYIINDPSINAFATGRDPEHASVAVTTGAIEKLNKTELEGVLAHELSHVKNYDIRVMMIVIVLVGIIVLISDFTIRGMWFGGGRKRNSDSDGGQLGMILMIVGIVLLVLSPIIAQLIKFAVSRKREFLADASGALLTRYPEGLASALEKIQQANIAPMQKANNATAHLYIANPFGKTKKFLSKVFSTHPPIEERIKALRSMA
ncbi:MAG: zinc metalloprotease HtpX [bacterium]